MELSSAENIALASLLFSIGSALVMATWGIARINRNSSEKIAAESAARQTALASAVEERNQEFSKLRREVAEGYRMLENNMGELGHSLRRALDGIREDMHKVELFGRDNYVRLPDFEKALELLRTDMRAMSSEVRQDIKILGEKVMRNAD